MFWELEKAIFGPEKNKWRIRGSKTPKPPEMPLKQGKTSQHHNWPRYMDCPQIGPKSIIKLGKERRKHKWYLSRCAHRGTLQRAVGGQTYMWGLSILPKAPFRRMSETPTTTTSQKSIAIHLPFVSQYASNLYCSAFGTPRL